MTGVPSVSPIVFTVPKVSFADRPSRRRYLMTHDFFPDGNTIKRKDDRLSRTS
jgi:hypothetical protein